MVVWRLRRPPDEKMDPPGNFVMFFSPTQGEGDLFIGGIVSLYFISSFFLRSLSEHARYFWLIKSSEFQLNPK